MDDLVAKAEAALASSLDAHRKRNEEIRAEREAREHYNSLWYVAQVQCRESSPDVAAFTALAKSIAEREKDRALLRLREEYAAELATTSTHVGLAVLTAKIYFTDAMLEANGETPDAEKVAMLVGKATTTWPYRGGIDLDLYHQDLASKRKADIERESLAKYIENLESETDAYQQADHSDIAPAKRVARGTWPDKLASLLLSEHGYKSCAIETALKHCVAMTPSDANGILKAPNLGTISDAFSKLFPGSGRKRGWKLYVEICEAGEDALLPHLARLAGDEPPTKEKSADKIPAYR